MVTEMDRGVAEIRSALEAEGLLENTLLMFMSDNGGRPGLGASNSALRGEKSSAEEGGIRVPALMRWPDRLPRGERFDHRFAVENVLPTLLSAASIQAQFLKALDGQDLWPALADGASVELAPSVSARGGAGNFEFLYAYFDGPWKLVRARGADGEARVELFQFEVDPNEQKDLAAERPEVLARLASAFDAIPKQTMIGADAVPEPDYGDNRGGSSSILPDETPPTGVPHAEAEWRDHP